MSEIEALRQELAEARRQQVAMAEALEAVALSTYDRDEMLRRLLRTAGGLCGAENGGIWLVQGDHLVGAVRMSGDPEEEAFLKEFSLPLTMTSSLNIRCLLSGEVIQVQDTHDGTLKNTALRDRFKFGSALTVPMRLNGAGIGVFALSRNKPSIFTDSQIAAVRSFAAQAVIAITHAKHVEELKRQRGDLNAALEQQTATAETLKTLSRSAFDLDAVLNTLVESAVALFDAESGGLTLLVDGEYRMRANIGYAPALQAFFRDNVLKPSRETVIGRVLLSQQVEQISDTRTDGELRPIGDAAHRSRSMLGVPLFRDGELIGGMVLRRMEAGGFTEREIELVKTYADQAVIAIGNAQLFKDIEARTAELNEALEQQTATAETLKTLSRSAFDLDKVLNTLIRSALTLCGAENGALAVEIDGAIRIRATVGFELEFEEFLRAQTFLPGRDTIIGRVLLSGGVELVSNSELDTELTGFKAFIRRAPHRSFLGVPLIRDGEVVGVFVLRRREPVGFTERQIELVKTFADQAVIAIGNVKLFKELEARTAELNEALEQQTATAETLKTLSRSVFDLDAVLNTLAESAVALCGADSGGLTILVSGEYRMRAAVGFARVMQERYRTEVITPGRGKVVSRALLSGEIEHVVDSFNDLELMRSLPAGIPMSHRTLLAVPLLQDSEIVGAILVRRREPGGFTERQIDMVKTFADQAVIAIRNAQLFKDLEARTAELNEALGQQTATAETLKTLSRSVFDLDAVLNTLAESARTLCGAKLGGLVVGVGGEYRMRATVGYEPAFEKLLRETIFQPDRATIANRVLLTGEIEMISDAEEDLEFIYRGGNFPRSVLGVPLQRAGHILGVLALAKPEPGGFTERQIELAETFADQAVIAIGNVQLFKDLEQRTTDLRDALEQQTATAETLKTLSRSAFDLDAVLNTLVASAAALCGAESGSLTLMIDGEYRMRAPIGFNRVAQEAFEKHVFTPGRGLVVSRALLSGEVEHVADSFEDPELMAGLLPGTGMGLRTLLGVPLIRDGAIIGAFLLRREQPGGFTERQIELVKTFADQAVIAIGNAQLFKDLGTRTEELRRSLEELRATQDRLIQSEKLASLGQLTAGVAHEIKNPLNFVNNFSKLSVELMEELGAALRSAELPERLKGEVEELSQALTDSMAKIHHHGQRADSIVKNMLLHARQDGGEQRAVDLNALIEESLNLAYHGARAERREFNIELLRDLDPAVGLVTVYPQGFTRVLLNLFSNGFYAACARAREPAFTPSLRVSTRAVDDGVEIRVRDNGLGVPEAIRDKLFTPFFTTKPAGEGTGLGLSLSYEIIVKQHGGSLSFETEAGAFTEFLITLPRLA